MPELPEVERVRISLEKTVIGRAIRDVCLRRRDIVATPDDPPGGFSRARTTSPAKPRRVLKRDLLLDDRILEIRRLGKQLALIADSGRALNIHLGMTGQLLWRPAAERLPQTDHIHITWRLDDDSRLVFRDPRRFGGIWTCPTVDDLLSRRWGSLGPDALTVTPAQLADRLARTARPIKAALLDQHTIAGIGNIYADEALFRAHLLPHRPANSLTTPEVQALTDAIREILQGAINAGGTTLRDYRDSNGAPGGYQAQHRVYGRAGRTCLLCSGALLNGILAQRMTVWCPSCQH